MWNLLLPVVTSIAGTAIATNANTRAAQRGGEAALQGAQIAADATTRGAATTSDAIMRGAATTSDAIMRAAAIQAESLTKASAEVRAGYEKSFQTLDALRQGTEGGTNYLRTTVNESQSLTPAQATQLEDLRRSVDSSIRGSDFAGSGRTAASLFKKAETDFTNTALDQNRQRALQAASTLHGTGTGATMAIANNQSSMGNTIAGLTQKAGEVQGNAVADVGRTTGNAISQAGQTTGNAQARAGEQIGNAYGSAGQQEAQAGISNANLMGRAIGEIGSTIANTQRESRYTDRLNKIEKSLGL